MRGVYSLIVYIEDTIIADIGVQENVCFQKGYWIYVGSAQGTGSTNLKNRLHRHFRADKKTHWHIDYLLKENVELIDAIWSESDKNYECLILSQLIASGDFIPEPKGFGAGDCKNKCTAHLVSYSTKANPAAVLERTFIQLGLNPKRYSQTRP